MRIKADEKQVEALNQWNEEQNTKGANKDKTSRPIGAYRCLPAESSVAAIREAIMDSKEEIDGEIWPLHVFLFDSELDNTIRQMKRDIWISLLFGSNRFTMRIMVYF